MGEKQESKEVEVTVKMKVYKDAFFLRQHIGEVKTESGEEFELSTGSNGTPIIEKKDGKNHWTCYTIDWTTLMNAVLAHREKEAK